MQWQKKARLQRVIASLPMSNTIYYAIQRSFGSLRPVARSNRWLPPRCRSRMDQLSGQEITGKVSKLGRGAVRKFLCAWCGAGGTTTVDLNAYLSEAVVAESIRYMRRHSHRIGCVLGEYGGHSELKDRLRQLVSFSGGLEALLEMANIEYLAPGDARNLPYPDGSFDFHISHAVLEHIPQQCIFEILTEARRLLGPDGLSIHIIDLSDHFSHDDGSITAVNFLQFTDEEWHQWAGNQFMFHNRLRAYEYMNLFELAGMRLLKHSVTIDQRSVEVLRNGFPLDVRYRHISPENLAIRSLNVMGTFEN
jgi:SAM-dependent methyltransferase